MAKKLINYKGEEIKLDASVVEMAGRLLSDGAMEDWGSNSNGYWFRWANGLQVCLHKRHDGTVELEGNSLGYARSNFLQWDFPKSFTNLLYTDVVNGGLESSLFVSGRENTNNNMRYRVGMMRGSNTNNISQNMPYNTLLIAVGLWK